MFDITLRPLKDGLFDPCCKHIPSFIKPLHITLLAFLSGLLSCYFISLTPSNSSLALLFWASNRALDCLDGALARHRRTASDLGGFLDLLGDFIVYSLLPISIAQGQGRSSVGDLEQVDASWRAVAFLEAAFHVNNFILFYIAAVAEKLSHGAEKGSGKKNELTSVMMRPALVEGMESGIMFTAMLAFPGAIQSLSWIMAGLVSVGIIQRTIWVVGSL